MTAKLTNAQIAWRAAQDIQDGAYVNLGIGFPEMVARFQPEGRQAIFHTENGILGFGARPASARTTASARSSPARPARTAGR